jgi:hypothetical protein
MKRLLDAGLVEREQRARGVLRAQERRGRKLALVAD